MNVRLNRHGTNPGIALIIVMLVIVVLGMLAAGLAYSMKVETKLARNTSAEPEMELLGLAGVELARYVLAYSCPNEPYDSLDQKWAGGWGGSCSTNGILADVTLENNELGRGRFSIKIIDLERKVNINYASRPVLEKTMDLLALDLIDSATIVDSIEDWRDRNENPQVNGAESAYYLGLPKPYVAKDGPIDDLSEMLLIRGVSPEIYWGPGGSRGLAAPTSLAGAAHTDMTGTTAGPVGLFDLFNTIGRMQININTASREVLRLLPGIDAGIADAIVDVRDGLDNVDGTEDDTPFHSPSELNLNVPGMNPQLGQQIQQFCSVRSFTFEVRVDAEIDQYKRRLIALVIRTGPRNVQLFNMHWE